MIIYFSGTGNTRYCAEMLGRFLNETPTELSVPMLRQPSAANIVTNDKRIIFMFPTYSWGIPPVVKRLITNAHISFPADAMVWMVTTCGDDCGLIAAEWQAVMKNVGLRAAASFSVQMPNTYVNMKGFDTDSEELANAKVLAAEARLKDIAERISRGMPCEDDVLEGKYAWIKTNIIRPAFDRLCMSPRKFEVDSQKCTACGLCIRSCPMENIAPSQGGCPAWGPHCAMCLRCYHICPSHAIGYDGQTENKGQHQRFLRK